LAEVQEERCADPSCTDEYDGFISCVRDVADAGDWDVCPDLPQECDAQRAAYDECIDPSDCGPGPGGPVVCEAVAACEGSDEAACIDNLTSERCSYPADSECRPLFDTYNSCIVDLLIAGLWEECPDLPEACREEWDAYASGCI